MEPSFTLHTTDTSDRLVHLIKVKGELKRGSYLDANMEWKSCLNNAKTLAKSKVIAFDLSDLKYWDTQGISEIIETILSINRIHPKRSGIIAPSDPHLLVMAKPKYPSIESDLVPWKKSQAELLEFLGS